MKAGGNEVYDTFVHGFVRAYPYYTPGFLNFPSNPVQQHTLEMMANDLTNEIVKSTEINTGNNSVCMLLIKVATLYFNRGLVRMEQNKFEDAILDFNNAMEYKYPGRSSVYNYINTCYQKLGQYEKSLQLSNTLNVEAEEDSIYRFKTIQFTINKYSYESVDGLISKYVSKSEWMKAIELLNKEYQETHDFLIIKAKLYCALGT